MLTSNEDTIANACHVSRWGLRGAGAQGLWGMDRALRYFGLVAEDGRKYIVAE